MKFATPNTIDKRYYKQEFCVCLKALPISWKLRCTLGTVIWALDLEHFFSLMSVKASQVPADSQLIVITR